MLYDFFDFNILSATHCSGQFASSQFFDISSKHNDTQFMKMVMSWYKPPNKQKIILCIGDEWHATITIKCKCKKREPIKLLPVWHMDG